MKKTDFKVGSMVWYFDGMYFIGRVRDVAGDSMTVSVMKYFNKHECDLRDMTWRAEAGCWVVKGAETAKGHRVAALYLGLAFGPEKGLLGEDTEEYGQYLDTIVLSNPLVQGLIKSSKRFLEYAKDRLPGCPDKDCPVCRERVRLEKACVSALECFKTLGGA